jgi:hypothetical protein
MPKVQCVHRIDLSFFSFLSSTFALVASESEDVNSDNECQKCPILCHMGFSASDMQIHALPLSVLCATFEIGKFVALVKVPTQKNIGPMVQLCLT